MNKKNNKKHTIIFAHGAGAPMNSDWMNSVTEKFKNFSVKVIRFEFPYMQVSRDTGKRMPPNRLPVLLEAFNDIINKTDDDVFIGGKSMGGRIATIVAQQHSNVNGVITFGYPFHPPAKPEKLRTENLKSYDKPCLIIQGGNDPFGKVDEWNNFDIDSNIEIFSIEQANHDLKPLKRTGMDLNTALDKAVAKAVDFMNKQTRYFFIQGKTL